MSEDRSVGKRILGVTTKAVAGLALVPPAAFVYNGGNPFPKKIAGVSAHGFDEAEATKALKAHMVDVILGYHYRDGTGHRLTQAELDYGRSLGRDLYNDYQNLYELHTGNGFYGVLIRDKHTNETSLVIAGMDYSYSSERRKADLDDAFMLTTGSIDTSQTKDAIAFARDAQDISEKRTGHGIDAVVGHSLGAQLAEALAAGGKVPRAKYYLYDGPGVVAKTVSSASRLYGIPASTVVKNLRDNCLSFSYTHNTVNTIGQQPGRAMTVNNDPTPWLNPLKYHLYTDALVHDTSRASSLTRRSNDEASYTAAMSIAAFIGLAGAPWVPYGKMVSSLKRRKEPEPGELSDGPRR